MEDNKGIKPLIDISTLPRKIFPMTVKTTVRELIKIIRTQNPVFQRAYMECSIGNGNFVAIEFVPNSSDNATNMTVWNVENKYPDRNESEEGWKIKDIVEAYESSVGEHHHRIYVDYGRYIDNYYRIDGTVIIDHPIMNMEVTSADIRKLGKKIPALFIDVNLT